MIIVLAIVVSLLAHSAIGAPTDTPTETPTNTPTHTPTPTCHLPTFTPRPHHVSQDIRVNVSGAGDQAYVAADMRADTAAISWAGPVPSGGAVFYRRFSAGAPVGAEIQANEDELDDDDQHSAISRNAAGETIVAWHYGKPGDPERQIYGRAFDASGAALCSEFRLNDFSVHRHQFPDVVAYTTGFLGVWMAQLPPLPVARCFDWSCNATSPEIALSASAAELPHADCNGSNCAVAWTHPWTGEVRLRFLTTSCVLGVEVMVSPSALAGGVSVQSNGGVVVALQDDDDDGAGIYIQRVGSDGSLIGAPLRVNQTTAGNQMIFELPPDPPFNHARRPITLEQADDFLVTWTSADQDGDGLSQWARRFNADGTPKGDEFAINSQRCGDQAWGSCGSDREGDVVCAWQSAHLDESGDAVAAASFLFPTNTPTLTPTRTPTRTPTSTPTCSLPTFTPRPYQQGDDIQVNINTHNWQYAPSIAMISDPNSAVIGWTSDHDNVGLYHRHYTSGPVGPEIRADEFPIAFVGSFSATARHPLGEVARVWEGGLVDVMAARVIGPYGGLICSEFHLASPPHVHAVPDVAASSKGFIAAWARLSPPATNEIVARCFARDCTITSDVVVLHDSGYEPHIHCRGPKCAVVWTEMPDEDGVFFRRIDSDCVLGGNVVQISATGIAGGVLVRRHDFIVVYEDQDADGRGIYAQRVAPDGSLMGARIPLNETTSGNQAFKYFVAYSVRPIITEQGDDFLVTWTSELQDGDGRSQWARRFNADGTPKGDEFAANSRRCGDQEFGSCAADGHGKVVFAWRHVYPTDLPVDPNADEISAAHFVFPTNTPTPTATPEPDCEYAVFEPTEEYVTYGSDPVYPPPFSACVVATVGAFQSFGRGLTIGFNDVLLYSTAQRHLRFDTSPIPDNRVPTHAWLTVGVEGKGWTLPDAHLVGDWHDRNTPCGALDYTTEMPDNALSPNGNCGEDCSLVLGLTEGTRPTLPLDNVHNVDFTGPTDLRLSIAHPEEPPTGLALLKLSIAETTGASELIVHHCPAPTPSRRPLDPPFEFTRDRLDAGRIIGTIEPVK